MGNKKNMLLTGSTQGIGKKIYEYFKFNYNIITVNRREFEGNNLICDLSNFDEICLLVHQIHNLEIDILINNAGGAEPLPFEKMKPEDLLKCTNLNYHAPVLLMHAVIQGMIKKIMEKSLTFHQLLQNLQDH